MHSITKWFKSKESRSSSVFSLIIVNLFPVFGVFYWGWEVFPIMVTYWSETVIMGFYNVLRLIYCQPEDGFTWISKFFMIPFFVVHYGMFTLVHGIFVVALFSPGLLEKAGDPRPALLLQIILQNKLFIVITALFLSHGYSFVTNYLRRGEYRRATLKKLMTQPYGRIVLLHITIIAGGFLIMILQSPLMGLLFFILLKIGMDLVAHVREHRKETGDGDQ